MILYPSNLNFNAKTVMCCVLLFHSFADSEKTLKELLFLRDLHFGFLPDDCEEEFSACFSKIGNDDVFAWKCLRLALLSRNEDLISVLLNHLTVYR